MVDSLYSESPVSSQRRLTCHRATGFFYFLLFSPFPSPL